MKNGFKTNILHKLKSLSLEAVEAAQYSQPNLQLLSSSAFSPPLHTVSPMDRTSNTWVKTLLL